MRTKINFLAVGMFLATVGSSLATVHYVDVNSANPTPPYTNWAPAAAVIQDAVDVAGAGDEIVVTNGTYATGGRVVSGTLLTNRVAVDKPLILRSVNGPQFTIIQGFQVSGTTNSDGAIRCVYLTNGVSLSGFTLTHGATRTDGVLYWDQSGGGAEYCTLHNCALTHNSADIGGGASAGGLLNCTAVDNLAWDFGGGAAYSSLFSCIVAYNAAWTGPNYRYSGLDYCCTSPLPTNGVGNISVPSLFVDYASANLRLQSNSPCINSGKNNAYVTTTNDLGGNPRIVGGTVDIGAYEFQAPTSVISCVGPRGWVGFGWNSAHQTSWRLSYHFNAVAGIISQLFL